MTDSASYHHESGSGHEFTDPNASELEDYGAKYARNSVNPRLA